MKNIIPALTISILIIFSGCSKKQDKKAISTTDISQLKKLKNLESKKSTKYDPCDCNKRSQKIIDDAITTRLKFDSVKELKADKQSKTKVHELATSYIELAKKCFEVNNARLMIESECNNLKLLETKKDSLIKLGIQIELWSKK